MPTRKQRMWFVIADGAHARILQRVGREAPLEPALGTEMFDPEAMGFARERGDDRPGRAFDTSTGSPHAMEPRSDPHVLRKQAFARRVGEVINDAVRRGALDALVLVAPPKTLGELRTALDDAAARLVVAESPKELLKTPRAELVAHLDALLAR